ncbi:uncharacterized protein PITG_17296 [Phytophthora infestans T30-4]|uniref:Uncharacterized protein n=1 Tax=Phytophthora infestans (strain T30-4) TaxID=403677 RepID=D0NVQ7_PHYIT|nr:uncharacterized protein PITG_17296 [Phytophthora infestans T30-4]EEY66738.1 conserved hypothetical protein [Phytophthora infestans T30-4]|eukprot:XP_002896803.1 conserved hypothetical protein [Phytophthora infestans T30-4]
MGKASRRKRVDEQQNKLFAVHGDGRNAQDRANARLMLDALQQKLEDDALREDGKLHQYWFCFINGRYVDCRRPRLTSGMKTRVFETHRCSIMDVAIVRVQQEMNLEILFTFGLDWWVSCFIFKNGLF